MIEKLKPAQKPEATLVPMSKPTPTPEGKLHDKAIEALIRRVRGFSSREVKTTYEVDPLGYRIVKNEVVTRKRTPPDLQAIIFTLTNLDPSKWRAKPGEEAVAGVENESLPDVSPLTEEALRVLAEEYPRQ